jgi:hypothetical protein
LTVRCAMRAAVSRNAGSPECLASSSAGPHSPASWAALQADVKS